MVITLNPVALSLGGVVIRWFGLIAIGAVVLGVWRTVVDARRRGVARDVVLDAATWAIPVGIVGARAVHVVNAWDFYLTRPQEIWQAPLTGLALWGGLVFGALAAAFALRHAGRARILVADAAAMSLPLAIALGRVGSFVNGDGQGRPTSLPWGTQYTDEMATVPDFGIPRHPAQVYDGLAALAIYLLLRFLPGTVPAGVRWWSFLVLYGGARVALGPVRADAPFLFGAPLDQILAFGAVLFGAVQLVWTLAVRRRAVSLPGESSA